jgi:cell division protein ZapE
LGDPAAPLMPILDRYREAVAAGELKFDAQQERAIKRLRALSDGLRKYRPGRRLFFASRPPRGFYLWGDVGRGKSMLMDLFFETVDFASKRRVHFNAFMMDVHTRIHAERQAGRNEDEIAAVARALAEDAHLLCFDEFQVVDVADAMILGRLFKQLFARGVIVVTTSNVVPDRLYEGGLNRQLFLPFIDLLKSKLDVFALTGPTDYRLHRIGGMKVYLTPLSPEADAAMDGAWLRLTGERNSSPVSLTVLGREVRVPRAARGAARFSFDDLCARPLAAPDYLAIAQNFHTVLIDHIPQLSPAQRNEARRFILLIDTLYDMSVKLICSAAVAADELYPEGDGSDVFRRTASRLIEMQSEDYLARGHGLAMPGTAAAD